MAPSNSHVDKLQKTNRRYLVFLGTAMYVSNKLRE